MSFSDPLSITISGVTTPLPRTGDIDGAQDGSVYQSADGLLVVTASHDVRKRARRMLRLDSSKIAPDTFKPAENVKHSMAVYTVFDAPVPAGYTNAEVLAVWAGYNAMLTATSNAMITKLLAGEH